MTRRTGHASQGDAAPVMVRVVRASTEPAAVTPPLLVKLASRTESTGARQTPRCANPSCGRPLERRATGRPARHCSGKCRQAAHRARTRAAAGRRLRDEDAGPAVTKPTGGVLHAALYRGAIAAAELQRQRSRPVADQLRSQRQGLLRRAARDLLRVLDQVAGPD